MLFKKVNPFLPPSIQPSPSERPAQWVLPPVHPQGVPVRPRHDRDGPEQSVWAAGPRPTQAGWAAGAHHDPRTQVNTQKQPEIKPETNTEISIFCD